MTSCNVLMHTAFGKRHLFLQDSETCSLVQIQSYNRYVHLHKTNPPQL